MFDFLPGKQASIKSITKGSHDTRLSQNNPGDGRRETRTPIHTLKSYFPLSTSCKEFFCVFLVSNKAASCFEFLSAFTFGNKTEIVFFNSPSENAFASWKLDAISERSFPWSKRTQDQTHSGYAMPAITLEGNQQTNTTSAGLEEEQQRGANREDAHPPSSSSFLPTVPGTAGLFVRLIDTVG